MRRRPGDHRRVAADGCAITEIGAVKVRGGEVLGEFQTLVNPGAAIPPFIAVLTGITDAMVAGAPPIEHGAAGVPRVRRGTRAGRPQRAVRRRLPRGRLRSGSGSPWPALRRRSTPRGWPAGCSPATRRPTASSSALARAVPRGHHARPPRAGRRPRDRRRAARADRAARQPRRAHRSRSCTTFTVAGLARAAAQAPPRRARCRTRRASTCSATSAAEVLYVGKSQATCAPGSAPTSPRARPARRMAEMVGLAERGRPASCARRRWRPRCASCG